MAALTLRNFTPDDIPQITALQQAYQHTYSHAAVIPGEVYLSPGFENGRNIFCAFDEQGILQGYAPLLPVLTDSHDLPHTVWAEVKAHPRCPSPEQAKDALFERVVQRACQVASAVPGHAVNLTFQYHPSETSSIDYVSRRGCTYSESVFRLRRDLAEALPLVPAPESLDIRRWHMDTEAEQQAYVQARNEAFPEALTTLADWQAFLASPSWQEGTTLTAFDGSEVVGCVSAYWDETISQMTGCKAAYTEYIFVRSSWRGRGIAAHLIAQSLAYLKEQGREAAFLEVKAANENALGLYLRLGYRKVDETRIYVLAL